MSKLTENVDEQPIGDFLSSNAVFKIPYFQRSYKWGKTEFDDFMQDLTSIVDEEEDVHFLGAIITHEGYSAASQPNVYEIVDGQQRISTCMLLFCSLAKTMSKYGLVEDAAAVLSSFVYLTQPKVKHPSNLKFYPSKGDRKQFRLIVEDVFNEPKIQSELGEPVLRFLPSSGNTKGGMLSQYRRALKYFDDIASDDPDLLSEYFEALSSCLTVVEIALRDPTNSSKIFERLNYRGVTVTTGDLVRNDIFSKLAGEEAHIIDNIHDNEWEPFFLKFPYAKSFEKYFFPIGLIVDPNVKKSQVFSQFQADWRSRELQPKKIISELAIYQDYYLAVSEGIEAESLPEAVYEALYDLYELGAPSSVYPFVMQVTKAVCDNDIDEECGCELIELVSSFLVRRAVCGIEPTGLHAVFKSLWQEMSEEEISTESFSKNLRKRPTVTVVSDEQFVNALKTRALDSANITRYLINVFEHQLPGDHPSDIAEIEHILPQKYKQHWSDVFSAEEHEELVNTIGNLIVISPPQNKKVQNFSYDRKKFVMEKKACMPHLNTSRQSIKSGQQQQYVRGILSWPKQPYLFGLTFKSRNECKNISLDLCFCTLAPIFAWSNRVYT